MSEKIKEIALKTGRGAIGVIPGGSLVSEFFTTPKERRLATYLEALDGLVKRVEEKHGIDSGTLAARDDFLDILFGTISLWLVNSDYKKLGAILNLLENVAIQPSADGAIDSIILRLLGDLSGSHLFLVLKYGENKDFNSTDEFHEMLGEESWEGDWGIISSDLYRLGILEPGGLSALGRHLLNRIKSNK